MNTTYPSTFILTNSGRGAWVTYPNIATLREVLDLMEQHGVAVDEPLTISHLANALGTFTFRPLHD